ncbi:MAG: DsbA family protein [Vibrio sp.]
MTTIHYIMDPQCGWCYAASPLMQALALDPRYTIQLHGGGLFSGANKTVLPEDFKQQIMMMDKRVTQLTGQLFSDIYYAKLLNDAERILDSDTPMTALLAVEALGGDALSLLHRMQIEQFVEGRSLAEINHLTDLVTEMGIKPTDFLAAYQRLTGNDTHQHIEHSRRLLRSVGGQGFPTMIIEHNASQYSVLEHSRFYGQPKQWCDYVSAHLNK